LLKSISELSINSIKEENFERALDFLAKLEDILEAAAT